jgi:NADH-quinone oxidoreductase subunit N
MVWLAVIAMLNSVISLFFYVKVLKVMYFTKPNPSDTRIPYSFGNYLILLLLIIPTIFFGLYPAPILRLAELSATIFGIK